MADLNYIAELDDDGNVLAILGTEKLVSEILDHDAGERVLVAYADGDHDTAYLRRWQDGVWVDSLPAYRVRVEQIKAEADLQAVQLLAI